MWTLNYDNNDLGYNVCTERLTFTSRTTGTISYTCNDGLTESEGTWRLLAGSSSSGSGGSGGGGSGGSGFAPADQAAFDRLVVGKRATSSGTDTIDFVSSGRFRETLAEGVRTGSYTWTNTGPNTGTLTQNYDGGHGVSCTSEVTFTSATTGNSAFACTGNVSGRYSWRLIDIPSGGGGGSGGSGGSGGGGSGGGACRAGLVVNPGESCTYKGHTFSVSASGRGSIAFFSTGNSIDQRGSTINGVRWNFHASKNSGSNSWTIHTAD